VNFTFQDVIRKSLWNASCVFFFFHKSACVLKVAEGQEICVIEAMKMQNSMTAAKAAKVSARTHTLIHNPVHYFAT